MFHIRIFDRQHKHRHDKLKIHHTSNMQNRTAQTYVQLAELYPAVKQQPSIPNQMSEN